MPSLLVISSAPATMVDDRPFLDRKFVDGMRFYCEAWEGQTSCILNMRGDVFPFGQTYAADQLPFDVTILPEGREIAASDLAGHDIVLGSGDDHQYLHLADICSRTGQKLVFIIEYIVETRRQIIFLDRTRSLPRKIYALLWMLRQEHRRRRAFRLADGIQANGYPAMQAYGPMNPNTVMYLDNRVGEQLLATEAEMAARERRLTAGAPLRLVHSGRLEPMKGSHDLIPIARRLARGGIDFELNIFGAGSLEPEIREGIARHDLQGRVVLNGVVDFETELVPFARENADIYLSCHRQSDPSCTYIESMGCGLAVAGYSNRMWSALCSASGAGWAVPLGNADALADAIAQAARDRQALAACCEAARSFAGAHSFEREFRKRTDHLVRTVGA